MSELAPPTYDIVEGCHRFIFPDATHLEILRPQRDAIGRLWAEVVAKRGDDRVFNRARLDLLDLRARLRFHAATASADGEIDWADRLLFALEHVLQTLWASEMSLEPEEPIASPSERVEPFPVGVLPTPLARLVTEGAAALPCPVDFLGVLMLSLLGAAIGTSRVLEVKSGWHEGPRIYAAVVAEPGSKKSPALDLVTTPYRRRQRTLHAAYLDDQARYQQELARYDRDLTDWKQQPGHRRARQHERPQAPLDLMPVKHMPELLSQLERLRALIWVRLITAPALGMQEFSPPDRLLEVSEAAKRLGVSKDYLYRHAKQWPFAVRIGPGQLRFSERGLEGWIKNRLGRA